MPIRRSASTRRTVPTPATAAPQGSAGRARRVRSLGVLTMAGLMLVAAGCSSGSSAVPAPQAAEPSAVSSPSSTPSASTPTAGPSASPTQAASATEAASPTPPAQVPATLQFSGTTVDGQPFDGASLVGKPTLVWFWAPWCPTCRSQIPQVQDIATAHPTDVNVIGVGSLDGGAAIKTFADSAPGITHLTDESGAIWRHFSVQQQSSFVLLDEAGGVVLTAGYGGSDELGQRVDELVGP